MQPVTASANTSTKPVRLLIVDDHHIVRQGLVALLDTVPDAGLLCLIVGGNSNKEIAAALFISEATVKTHINSLLSKLGVSDRTQAATTALQRGIVHLD